MADYLIRLSVEEEKALLVDMVSIQEWLNNAIHNKARQCVDEVCRQALEDNTDTILSKAEKQQIATELAKQGRILSTVKSLPEAVKYSIVAKAKIQSAKERELVEINAVGPLEPNL